MCVCMYVCLYDLYDIAIISHVSVYVHILFPLINFPEKICPYTL